LRNKDIAQWRPITYAIMLTDANLLHLWLFAKIEVLSISENKHTPKQV